MLPGHIPLQIIIFGKERIRNVLYASQRRVNKNSLTWWCVLKTSWRYLCKTSWRRLEDVSKTIFEMSWRRFDGVLKTSWQNFLKISWSRFEDFFKTSWRCLEDVLRTSWKRLEHVLKTYGLDEYIDLNQDVLKTSSEDVMLRWAYSCRSRRFQDVFKTSSKDKDERRLQDVFIKMNVCCECFIS